MERQLRALLININLSLIKENKEKKKKKKKNPKNKDKLPGNALVPVTMCET